LTELIGGDPRLRLKLSHYNPIVGSDVNPTSEARKRRFYALCRQGGLNTFAWESMALDIAGGCGQLRSANES
jgi:adenine C2-methylase RlmN of 23S rRNA A2503 and tRNA A37